uniref:Transmembrane protein 157 n=1 Tax=Anas platyrhynchos platyrhynchos TaxID=8840 RepID=U3HYW6_ANAPP
GVSSSNAPAPQQKPLALQLLPRQCQGNTRMAAGMGTARGCQQPHSTAPPNPCSMLQDSHTRSAGGQAGGQADVSAPPEQGQPMTQRALSVLVLASAALIVYFVIRTVRLRRRNRKTRRYGVLDTNIENMELTPLEQDDDDDDTTLFDANHPRRFV